MQAEEPVCEAVNGKWIIVVMYLACISVASVIMNSLFLMGNTYFSENVTIASSVDPG